MEQSNITYDHIALSAMEVFLNATVSREPRGLWQRLRRLLGMEYKKRLNTPTPEVIAITAHDIADAMVQERERRQANNNQEAEP